MNERLIIVIEYEITGDMQQALTEVMSRIKEGVDRLDPEHVKVASVHVGVDEFVDRVLDLFAKDANAPTKAPSRPVEATTAAPGPGGHPDPKEALQGRRLTWRRALREWWTVTDD